MEPLLWIIITESWVKSCGINVGCLETQKDLKKPLVEIKALREDFYKNVKVPGTASMSSIEQLAKAGRVADFLELGELFAKDALERTESCGGHFREESQTPEGEALRDDKNFHVCFRMGIQRRAFKSQLHKEELKYEEIEVKTRSYK